MANCKVYCKIMKRCIWQEVINLQKNEDIETARLILNNAVKMNFSKELILRISQKLDQYVNEYYHHNEDKKMRE